MRFRINFINSKLPLKQCFNENQGFQCQCQIALAHHRIPIIQCRIVKNLWRTIALRIQQRLLKVKKTYTLDNLIELIYKNKSKNNEETILQLLQKDENFFQGKFLQLNDPNGFQSIYSDISGCQRYQEGNKLFLKLTLENGSCVDLHYKQDSILEVYSSQKKRVKLLGIINNFWQKNSRLPGKIEFFKQKQELSDNNLQIQLGFYTLSFGEINKCTIMENGKYKAEWVLQSCQNSLKYIIDIRYQDQDCSKIEKIYFKQKSSELELSLLELNQVICYYFQEKMLLQSITPKNVVENIQIKEVIYDENKEKLKKYEEITVCKDNILSEFKQQKNLPLLDQILEELVLNDFKFKTNVVLNVVKENIEKIQQINKQLNLEESQESILKNIVLEANYTNLIQKGQTLQCLKVMDLLKNSFQHTESIKEMDIIIFLGATGSGKSTSINYYLGHELVEYEQYGKKFLKLKNEKNLPSESFTKIGHSLAVSETTFIQGYKVQDMGNLMLCDCPGFDDTRGDIYDLNIVSIGIKFVSFSFYFIFCMLKNFCRKILYIQKTIFTLVEEIQELNKQI